MVDASTGLPLDGVRVTARGYGEPTTTLSTVAGTFELDGVVPGYLNRPDQVRVTAEKAGYVTQSRTVTVFCSGTITIDFGAPDGGSGSVAGTVTDADTGAAIADVLVVGGYGGSTTTDATGHYVLATAPVDPDGTPRDWVVTAIAPDGRRQAATVTVRRDAEARHDFELAAAPNRPPTADDVPVTTAAGAPVAVTLSGSDPEGGLLRVRGHLRAGARLPERHPAGPHLHPRRRLRGTGLVHLRRHRRRRGAEHPPRSRSPSTHPRPPPPTDHDPVARIAPVATVTEGGTVVLDGTASSDPDGDTLSYHWVLGGSSYDGATIRVPFGDDFSGDATLTVDDGLGGTDSASTPVVVQNAPPVLLLDPLPHAVVGEPFELRGTVQDPGTDTHTATIDWGDGTHDTSDVGTAGLVLTHSFAAPGSTRVGLTVCDDDGGCVHREFPVDVAAASSPPTEPPGTTVPPGPGPGSSAPPPATTGPPPGGTTAPPTVAPPAPVSASGQLPYTGSSPRSALALGLLAIGLGGLLVAARRAVGRARGR